MNPRICFRPAIPALALAAALTGAALPTPVAQAQDGPTVISNAAHQQFVFAYRLLQRNEHQLAAEAFDEYLNQFPRDEKRGDGLYYRAMLARRAGNSRKAVELLEGAPAPKLVPPYALELLKGQAYVDLKAHEQAGAVLEAIRPEGLQPVTWASVLYLRGVAYRGMGNLPAAAEQLRQVGELDSPLRAQALLDLARVQAELGQADQALASLRQALTVGDPQVSPEAARLAGDLSYEQKAHDQAVEFYQQVLTQHGSSREVPTAVLGLMWAHFQADRFTQVIDAHARYREQLRPQDQVTAGYLAGSAQQALGRHDQAAATLAAIADRASGSPLEDKVLYKLAASRYELGQYDAMTQALETLRRRQPQSPLLADADFLRALAAARQDNPARGVADLTRIVNQGAAHPYYAQALAQRAALLEKSQALEAAADDYRRLLQHAAASPSPALNPTTLSEARLRLVDLAYRLERFDEAERVADELLAQPALDPLLQAEGLYRRGLARIRLQRYEPALADFTALGQTHPTTRFAPEAGYYRGLLLMTLKRPDQALPDLTLAAGDERLDRPLRINALRLITLRQQERGQDRAAAETLLTLEKLVGLEQLAPEEQLALGRHFIDQGESQTGLKYLRPVLARAQQAPPATQARAMLLAAQALRKLNDLSGAISTLHQALAVADAEFGLRVRLELARTLAQNGQSAEAMDYLRGLIGNDRDRQVAAEATFEAGQLQRELALGFSRAGESVKAAEALEEARKFFKRVVLLFTSDDFSPLPELSHLELADLARMTSQPEQAEREWRELAQKHPDGPYATFAQAMLDRPARRSLLQRLQQQAGLDPRLARRVEAELQRTEATP